MGIALLLCIARSASAVSPDWVENWRADLAFAADTLPRVHARLFHTLSEEEFTRELDSLVRRLPELEHSEITVELARIMARVLDGHILSRSTWPRNRGDGA